MPSSDGARKAVTKSLSAGLDGAVKVSRPVLIAHIQQSRRRRPDATPEQIIDALGRRFTATVAGTGAAVGASAIAPGVNTPMSLAFAAGDVAGYMSFASLYVFAVAEVHGIPIHDMDRRRTLLMGVLLGDAGAQSVQKVAGRTGAHWANKVVQAIPMSSIKQVNKVLGHNFVTKYGTKQGVLVLGKQVPFGVGAAIGGVGNAAFARFTIRSAKRAFGPAPETWPVHLASMVDLRDSGPVGPDTVLNPRYVDDGAEGG
ncbi:hypothetical protein ATK17_2369 [Branchiibius hedensis]|uniref:EcsC protein family protein n=1 Tax=Branchiibius hedensis TaxID=672460 RepID=A0A2Y8ZST9_9MICO|nr:hypothetical protein [Branchiibius hedensis]PWJ26222.1 hypothetical protein ATK17_2369 [Branchiibius hedensis]SSA35034.1 hypothetical protein SAMN04489750_2369 [Branchiibius hedensis]